MLLAHKGRSEKNLVFLGNFLLIPAILMCDFYPQKKSTGDKIAPKSGKRKFLVQHFILA
jgi:hypothetical protein